MFTIGFLIGIAAGWFIRDRLDGVIDLLKKFRFR